MNKTSRMETLLEWIGAEPFTTMQARAAFNADDPDKVTKNMVASAISQLIRGGKVKHTGTFSQGQALYCRVAYQNGLAEAMYRVPLAPRGGVTVHRCE